MPFPIIFGFWLYGNVTKIATHNSQNPHMDAFILGFVVIPKRLHSGIHTWVCARCNTTQMMQHASPLVHCWLCGDAIKMPHTILESLTHIDKTTFGHYLAPHLAATPSRCEDRWQCKVQHHTNMMGAQKHEHIFSNKKPSHLLTLHYFFFGSLFQKSPSGCYPLHCIIGNNSSHNKGGGRCNAK